MWNALKYGIWNAAVPQMEGVNALAGAGYAPLAAMILSARGLNTPQAAHRYLDCSCPLDDPFLLTDMDLAAGRVGLAMAKGEKIAVFGDYDVDGITATCLLTDFLRSWGCDCVPYIPGRLEEGYGLNPMAIRQLHDQGVNLIVTVDCGITAMEEAELCRSLGMDLVITDHHECKGTLPQAVAVVDPHRPDGGYPHKNLSGVGVAFKLAAALSGSQEDILARYADMVCLGTVADVMPLTGENRVFVSRGLSMLRHNPRPGIAALMAEGGCQPEQMNASSVGYVLAPRINAAGRMGNIPVAVELFLTQDPDRARVLAEELCRMNRERQSVESEIYAQAVQMLPQGAAPAAIVLAEESWHQGVVGIVASRIAEEYGCPTFLICLDGDRGKASSRSFGGFNLFTTLTALSDLLESYGGHELAAGFTIARDKIPAFREAVCRLAEDYYTQDAPRTVLEADCVIPPELFTLSNVDALEVLEPCGNGCPKPVLMMKHLQIQRMNPVGGGKHLRLRLQQGHYGFNAIYFSCGEEAASLAQGDLVDVAFLPQVNDYRGERTVQMNIVDIRPSCSAPCDWGITPYHALVADRLEPQMVPLLLPDRARLGLVWRYLSQQPEGQLRETPMCLCRKIVRWSESPMSVGMLLTCLDIFADVKLLELSRQHKYITIRLLPWEEKADISKSRTMQRLMRAKEE